MSISLTFNQCASDFVERCLGRRLLPEEERKVVADFADILLCPILGSRRNHWMSKRTRGVPDSTLSRIICLFSSPAFVVFLHFYGMPILHNPLMNDPKEVLQVSYTTLENGKIYCVQPQCFCYSGFSICELIDRLMRDI